MKVLDLRCERLHVFEGWFGSEADFQGQLGQALVSCPVCGSTSVHKILSAPRLNLGAVAPDLALQATASKDTLPKPASPSEGQLVYSPGQQEALAQLQNAYMAMARQVLKNTEDVGNAFAVEARKIHYGESPDRSIRGQATPDEAAALREEGIDIAALPLPPSLKEPLH